MMKKILRKLFLWLFNEEINEIRKLRLQSQKNITEMEEFLKFIKADVGVDINVNSPNWVMFSIQGKKRDIVRLIKFENDKPIQEIMKLVRMFDSRRVKIDSESTMRSHIKEELDYGKIY